MRIDVLSECVNLDFPFGLCDQNGLVLIQVGESTLPSFSFYMLALFLAMVTPILFFEFLSWIVIKKKIREQNKNN